MKLIRLAIKNYRQFYGEASLSFSQDKDRNVTVIHGENGSGKTSLLNAFKWCLYNETDFDTGTSNLLNERAIAEALDGDLIQLEVRLVFMHEDKRYDAVRSQSFRKISGIKVERQGGALLSLDELGVDGQTRQVKNPEIAINRLLPRNLHGYFFFNGERIEKLAYASASGEIRRGIKNLMGLQIVERASAHLDTQVLPGLRRQKKASDPNEGELLDKLESTEARLQSKRDELEEHRSTKTQLDIEIDELSEKLKKHEVSSEKARRLDDIEKQITEKTAVLGSISERRRVLISRYGYLSFIAKAVDSAKDVIDQKREKKELPAGVRVQFLDDLLGSDSCICGASLSEGTQARKNLIEFRDRKRSDSDADALNALGGMLGAMKIRTEEVSAELRQLRDDFQERTTERRELFEARDELEKDLDDYDDELVAQWQSQKTELRKQRDERVQLIGSVSKEVDDLKVAAQELEQRWKKAQESDSRHREVLRKIQLVEECRDRARELLESLAESVREKLSERVNETFSEIIRKAYWAEINEDYELDIFKEIQGAGKQLVAEKSTAESQITSLSFIGSVISMAKEKFVAADSEFFRGGIYPIVMDSPFGALDLDYRRKIAKYIPALADQVIVLASETQWKGGVEDECGPRIGSEFSIIYHTPDPTRPVDGVMVQRSSGYEFSAIAEGYYVDAS